MPSLYEISGELRELLLDTDELDPVLEEKIDRLAMDLYGKADGICKVLAEIEGEASVYKHEIDRLMQAMQVKLNTAARLKTYLKNSLEFIGQLKLKTELFSLSVCRNSAPSVDVAQGREADLPTEFQRHKIEPDNKAIAAAWKDGKELPAFVSVSQGTHLRIK